MAQTFTNMRARLTALAKATEGRDLIEKGVLKVAIGAIETQATGKNQGGKPLTDEQEIKQIKTIVEGNEESMKMMRERGMESDNRYKKLVVENEVLGPYVPRTLSAAEILTALQPVAEQIKAAKDEGPARGIAMKLLKEQKLAVDGKDVAEVIKTMRGAV